MEQDRQALIERNREFLRWKELEKESDSDQSRGVKEPPLTKAPMGGERFKLSRKFDRIPMEEDYMKILWKRRSNRVFTDETMNLRSLSFLLWACQGVKGIRGDHYATLRTVPSCGARHCFETYLYVIDVDELPCGLYHYLPMEHELELIREIDPKDEVLQQQVTKMLCDQDFVIKANVIFFFSVIPYRAEWRYGAEAHRSLLIDAGVVLESLYLAGSALDFGVCSIAGVEPKASSELFGLDGTDEFMICAAPVGTISDDNEALEQSIYDFLKEE